MGFGPKLQNFSCPIVIMSVDLQHLHENFLISFIVINALVAFFAVFLNLLVAFTIARTPSLRTPSNILILGLAISDFSAGFITQPVYCVSLYSRLTQDFLLYCSSFMVQKPSVWIFAIISFFTLSAITTDRFLAVQLHLRYQELITAKRYGIVIFCIWVASICVGAIRVFAEELAIAIVIVLVFLVGLLLMNMVFIFKIYRVVHRHAIQIQAQQQSVQQSIDMPRYKKSVNTMYYVIGAFMLCYVPYAGVLTALSIETNQALNILHVVSLSLIMFGGILNPVIYFWRIQGLRQEVLRLLKLRR